PSPAAKAHRETYVPSRPTYYTSAEMVESLLRSVPEVDLDADYLKRTKAQISDRVKEIVAVNKDEKDAFIRDLMKKRTDLAGLPFLMGQDCSLAKDQAKQLALRSLEVRTALGELGRSRPRTSQSSDRPSYLGSYADVFWADLTERRWTSPEGVRALQQILGAENSDFRLGLMEHLKQSKEAHATEALIRHAVFDLDPNVRSSALAVLRERPAGEVRPALLKSLRYPWAPIAQNAAQAIVTLELKETIPDLIALLDAADPDAPFGVIEDGKAKTMVRELVRINHHRNCMLCHAPLEVTKANLVESRDLPVGPIPSGSEPLPPSSSPVYYTPRSGSSLVRADVTYLRQDFSLPMKVENSGKWSPMQRYDFLVRTRAASELEMGQQRPAVSAFKVAVVDALIGLTGKHAAPAAQAWRDALAEPPIAPKVKATR
ncbi:MAG: HEAT repeat domain-containing protein, partial [Planctomycetes bacterium]|nr:HEAT repeat domain-containing protein [Planctomycetota bacterium]